MTSTCCKGSGQVALVVGGIVLAVGVAATVWTLFAKRGESVDDPFEVADRRIDELEDQLHRLREVIAHSS
jgi:hypothetical protein